MQHQSSIHDADIQHDITINNTLLYHVFRNRSLMTRTPQQDIRETIHPQLTTHSRHPYTAMQQPVENTRVLSTRQRVHHHSGAARPPTIIGILRLVQMVLASMVIMMRPAVLDSMSTGEADHGDWAVLFGITAICYAKICYHSPFGPQMACVDLICACLWYLILAVFREPRLVESGATNVPLALSIQASRLSALLWYGTGLYGLSTWWRQSNGQVRRGAHVS